MPHRTTYIFPRQFPDPRFDASPKFFFDHEKKIVKESFIGDSDPKVPKNSKDETVGVGNGKSSTTSTVSDRFTSDKIHGKQFGAFANWLVDKKGETTGHVKVRLDDGHGDDERQLLLPPEVVVAGAGAGEDQGSGKEVLLRRVFRGSSSGRPPVVTEVVTAGKRRALDRHVSLQRLLNENIYGGPPEATEVVASSNGRGFHRQGSVQSLASGSSYGGSLFSGTTLDGNFSSGFKDSEVSTTREDEEESRDSLVQRTRERYCLQLTLAKRLTEQASIVSGSIFLQECAPGGLVASSDAETVSYRLWVSGCLSYTDRISDGFYNILGVNPYMWQMCNELEEGRQLPPLLALQAVEPSDSSMEVVLVDKHEDARLEELENKAQELYFASENTLVLVEKLGKLVAIYMGGTFPVEQGDLHMRWKLVSKRLKDFQKCIVLPIGSMSMGLCRHRAILFKKLADSIGLPCRIAQGCKYCVADHRSSCLVQIEDDRKFPREYVVDLVGKPGNVHCPDSSINGGLYSSVPSPFQISHLKEFRQPCMDKASCREIPISKHSHVCPENSKYSGSGGGAFLEELGLPENPNEIIFSPNDRFCGGSESSDALDAAAAGKLRDEYSKPPGDKVVISQMYKHEIVVSQSPAIGSDVRQPKINLSGQSDLVEAESRFQNQGKYLNLEPSLALDWLEISWDELQIKERVGAGCCS